MGVEFIVYKKETKTKNADNLEKKMKIKRAS